MVFAIEPEPYAAILHVRICAGASGNRRPYRDKKLLHDGGCDSLYAGLNANGP